VGEDPNIIMAFHLNKSRLGRNEMSQKDEAVPSCLILIFLDRLLLKNSKIHIILEILKQ
jgi:hypothetical protein